MIRALILALALLAAPAIAKPLPSSPLDEPRRQTLLRALHTIGVAVGATWPIGESVFQVEEIIIESPRPGEVVITVRTKLLR